jgi:hypothetical protein
MPAHDAAVLVAGLGGAKAVADLHDEPMLDAGETGRSGGRGVTSRTAPCQPGAAPYKNPAHSPNQAAQEKDTRLASREIGSWTAFLVMAFAVVGLLGAFATYAAQIPLERALARDTALDQARAASQSHDQPRLEMLRDALGDSADHLDPAPGYTPDRIDAERLRMRDAFRAEAEDVGFRLRIVIAAFTAAGALFGAFVLGIVRNTGSKAKDFV